VSFGSSLDAKELVKQAIDIVDLVGKYIQLRRQGRGYVGLCPWHADSRPSLQVNQERQSFKCWVCDVGGDIFSFVMKMEGVTFPEALALLADQAGVTIKPARQERGAANPQDKRALYEAMAWAEKQYHECLLKSPDAEPARRYLTERGISPENVEKFHLGFSPIRWDWIIQRGMAGNMQAKMLEAVGLLAQSDGNRLYDRFRGRVLFSIRDVQGRPVGLGGRVLPETGSTSPAKYVNSPETPLFHKSRLLYGLDAAREAIRKSHVALVMEGYTDCIMAHQYGFENAVAVLGTALGAEHVQILKRFADQIVLVLDGDEAGQRRTAEVLELFVAENVDLRIVTLPEELDPCEFLQARGAEAFREILDNQAVDALEHAYRHQTRGIDLANDVHAASEALERLVAIVAKAPRLRHDTTRDDRFREEKILQRLATSFRVPEKTVRERLTALRRNAARRPGPTHATAASQGPVEPADAIDPMQRELLEILVGHPQCLPLVRETISAQHLASRRCRAIYEALLRLSDAGQTPTYDRLMLEFEDPAIKSLLVDLEEVGTAKGIIEPEAVLQQWIVAFHYREPAKENPEEAGTVDAMLQEIQRERARRGIPNPTDG
jgi:DNA primase